MLIYKRHKIIDPPNQGLWTITACIHLEKINKLLWRAFFVDVVAVIDENLFALRDGLEASDAAAMAEPAVNFINVFREHFCTNFPPKLKRN